MVTYVRCFWRLAVLLENRNARVNEELLFQIGIFVMPISNRQFQTTRCTLE